MQIGGLASGIDTQGLIDQLISIERKPILQMNSRKAKWQKQMDAWREINTKLDSLKTKIVDLRKASVFQAQTTTTTNDKAATATSTGSSIGGTYNIEVIAMASATTVSSTSPLSMLIDSTQPLNVSGLAIATTSGTFTINGAEISIDVATESLDAIVNKINSSAAGVTASYDPVSDKFSLASNDGTEIRLGSGADTSNFLEATKVLSQTGTGISAVTSSSKLGAVKLGETLQNSRLSGIFTSTTGTFSINGVEFTYDTTIDSLQGIINKVNDSAANVVISYDAVNGGLILKAKNTGRIGVELQDVQGNLLNLLKLDGAQTLGYNASYKLDGTLMTSSSNSVSNVVGGLTFELKGIGTASVNVQQDVTSTVDKIKAFVEQYNSLIDYIGTKMAKGAELQGDTTLAGVQSSLRTKTTGIVQGLTSEFKQLSAIGIDSDRQGKLTVNETKLKEALSTKSNSVYELFNSTDGVATRLETEIKLLVEKNTGLIATKQEGYNNRIKDLNDRIEIMEERLERKREFLLKQFTAMEKAMSQMMNQGSWLEGQLGNLAGWTNSSN